MKKVAEIKFKHGIDERRKYEISEKEWCDDVVVQINGKEYSLYFVSKTRFLQEITDLNSHGDPYYINEAVVVIEKVTYESILNGIEKLIRNGQIG